MRTTKLILLAIMFSFMGAVGEAEASDIDFQRDIEPIFEDHCLHCHGEDEQESGFRLDRRVSLLRGGDYGQRAVVPGDVQNSYLIDVVTHADADMAMPPDDDKLSDEQIDLLKRWIEQGAIWPGQMDEVAEEEVEHWAFLPLKSEFDHQTIDDFLTEKLTQSGLAYNAPADARSLIRRASIVLTGLAPTPERTETFRTSFAANADVAYAELVDELLASPHFGERWAQHWLDVIRWAETNGSESNLYRKNAWLYRDYVVRAFNEDKPYDQFVREQLAGDLMGAGDATGFLVSGPHVPAATVGQEESAIRQARADRLDEVLQTVGASVMGVTIGCARCHNHKFDPFSIQDYYSMTAVFQDIEFGSRYPELSDDHPRMKRKVELQKQLHALRKQMLKPGWGWVEDWQGYQEVRFPPKTVDAIRISFDNRWVQADEIEIMEAGKQNRNVAKPEFGTVVTDNPATHVEGQPISRLVDGVFGTKGWRGKSPPKSKTLPWLQFQFTEPVNVDAIRISSNREDFYETDYLEGMNKSQYGEFKIEARDAEGNWKPFSSTAAMKKKTAQDDQRQQLQAEIQSVITDLLVEGPQPAFLAQFVEPVETFVFSRGSPESPRDRVFASAPKLLDGNLGIEPDAAGPMRRKALGDWLVNPDNPLTPRVASNRIWHHIFGTGIVSTPSDFGKAGALPSHPKLLDWLASQFVDSGWSVKEMVRMIVMSEAFRQSSAPREDGLEADASAVLLWRFPPRRVEAEVIRDSMLLASGRLDESIGGPSYRIHNVKKRYAQWEVVDNSSDETWRRMLYQERMRRVDDRIFTAFDFPDCGQIRAKRPVSTTPLQALNLMNSDFVVSQSELLALRAKDEAGEAVNDQIVRCFELLLCRQPSQDELEAAIEFCKSQELALLCRTLINTNEFAFLP
ncbi:Planctomycete cytochrome C [Rubripirellula amarantea]|uniref:Planctomycete cytochrome C n=1 Tax=Rubripirellula amarantea TaxID=2527999 RepID=A0A5C5WUF9_9BACT|nr:PSD1 and planctomycete cytochrome C domain-containing protein [Rubripirellula amarantea]TWT54574.1 Planctomycete cytochrome C [Rubripirellula amarantea]